MTGGRIAAGGLVDALLGSWLFFFLVGHTRLLGLIPGLLYLFGAPVCVTMGTSLASMIPMAVVGGGIKPVEGYVAVGAGPVLATGSIAGAQVGAATTA